MAASNADKQNGRLECSLPTWSVDGSDALLTNAGGTGMFVSSCCFVTILSPDGVVVIQCHFGSGGSSSTGAAACVSGCVSAWRFFSALRRFPAAAVRQWTVVSDSGQWSVTQLRQTAHISSVWLRYTSTRTTCQMPEVFLFTNHRSKHSIKVQF